METRQGNRVECTILSALQCNIAKWGSFDKTKVVVSWCQKYNLAQEITVERGTKNKIQNSTRYHIKSK